MALSLACATFFSETKNTFAQTASSKVVNTNDYFAFQTLSLAPPPLPPSQFNPDPKTSSAPPQFFQVELTLKLKTRVSTKKAPATPQVFNPDPGVRQTNSTDSFFTSEFGLELPKTEEQAEEEWHLPREKVRVNEMVVEAAPPPKPYGQEPLPKGLELPRENVWLTRKVQYKWDTPDYPLAQQHLGYPPNSEPVTNRWRVGFTPWRRYTSGSVEMPYETPTPALWHPYHQSILKGDSPIIGQDIFLDLTAEDQLEFEARRLPVPSGISAAQPGSAEFFGRGEQVFMQNNFSFTADLFEGETVFQPVHWAVRIQPVFNVNYLDVKETGVVNPDPRGSGGAINSPSSGNGGVTNPGDVGGILGGLGSAPSDFSGTRHTQRRRIDVALQQAFGELHLGDLSDTYDFFALRVGNQPFNSDFRGFIFNDVNSGARLFGNYDNNRWQYNLALFDMREKDSNSELNSFDERNQRVVVLNAYRQDFLVHGYTAQWSFQANIDQGGTHYDQNNNITRPAPIGTVRQHDVRAYYLGWAGDGHIGRLNIDHQFYQAFGQDDFNGIAGQQTDINAQMAALELSYDRDWIRYKASFLYASGDDNPEDGTASGFDGIVDNPNFTGGPFSYWVRQGFNLAGTSVNLKNRNSLFPTLRTSKTEGQANFVNPGVFIYGLGTEIDVTPKLKTFLNFNYIRFAETAVIKQVLFTDKVNPEVGYDLSIGFQYRPFLTDNVIISTGFGTLIPGKGYRDIYRRSTDPVPGYNSLSNPGETYDFLYSGLIAITLTY